MHDDGEKNFRQIPGSGHTDIICSDFEGLTQVSRRVRSEFLPLFKSHLGVKVSMLDLEEFMQKVIVPALGDSTVALPCNIIIQIDDGGAFMSSTKDIDITPLIRIAVARPSLRIRSSLSQRLQSYGNVDKLALVLKGPSSHRAAWQIALDEAVVQVALSPFQRHHVRMVIKRSFQRQWIVRMPNGRLDDVELTRRSYTYLCSLGIGENPVEVRKHFYWVTE